MLWSACGPSNFTRRGRAGERNYMYVCASPSLVFSSVQLFNVLISSLYQFMFSFPPCSPPLSLSLSVHSSWVFTVTEPRSLSTPSSPENKKSYCKRKSATTQHGQSVQHITLCTFC